MTTKSETAFARFHARKAGTPVYPFHRAKDGIFEMDVTIPAVACIGTALRVLYRSDKWEPIGKTVDYYHNHGPDELCFSAANKVKFFVPRSSPEGRKGRPAKFPHRWPSSVAVLGTCTGWYVEPPNGKDDNIIEGIPSRCLLVSSPDGWISRSNHERCFLAIIDQRTGKLEGAISGPGLKLTKDGIEG